uniref:Uncharacterized protein n=1 Tax=Plectus sambesii TaxID=2011161 RepID=A0A914VM70_9BILA
MELPAGMMGPLAADEELQALLETVDAAAAEPAVVPVAYRKRASPATNYQYQAVLPKQIKLEPPAAPGESYGLPPASQYHVAADKLNNETNHRKTKVYISGGRMLKTEEL